MKFVVKLASSLFLLTLLATCKDQGTLPEEKLKKPLEMRWTADTLSYPGSIQTMMLSIWASNAADVWTAGHEAMGGSGSIWHYDGLKWKISEPMNDITRGFIGIRKIMGLSPNSVWAVGDRYFTDLFDVNKKWYKDMILNYDGAKWKEYTQNSGCRVLGLYCSSPTDIWACGDSGSVFHYDGVNWKTEKVKINLPVGAEHFLKSVAVINNTTYLLMHVVDVAAGYKQRYYLIKGMMNNWTIADSMLIYKYSDKVIFGDYELYVSHGKELYSCGLYGIWKYNGSNWEQSLKTNDYRINGMTEISNNYKIAVGDFGNVLFYDGAEWNTLRNLGDGYKNVHYQTVWTDGKEIFVVGFTGGAWPQKTIVWHGK